MRISFIVACLAAVFGVTAWAQDVRPRKDYPIHAGVWNGEATYSGGRFLTCVVYLDLAGEKGVAFGVGPNLALGVEIMDLEWQMKRDSAALLQISVDGRTAVEQAGTFSRSDQAGASFDDPEALLAALRNGREMTIVVEDSRFDLPLPDTYQAIVEASRCASAIAGLARDAGDRPTLRKRAAVVELTAAQERRIAEPILAGAGISGMDFEVPAEIRAAGQGLRWQLPGAIEGYSYAVRDAPERFDRRQADVLIRMARRDCAGEPQVELLDQAQGEGWSALRLSMICNQLESGNGRLGHYSIIRYANGIGLVMATEVGLNDLATEKTVLAASEIGSAIWRSAAFRSMPSR